MIWFIVGVLVFSLAWPLICWFGHRDKGEAGLERWRASARALRGGVVPPGTIGIRPDEVPALLSRDRGA